jgi:hypothetical protein
MKKKGIVVVVQDWGERMNQRSFNTSEIWNGININNYEKYEWVEAYGEDEHKKIKDKAKDIGWDVKIINLYA